MKIRQKLVVKGKNVPEFRAGMGKGVLAIQEIEFNGEKESDIAIAMMILEEANNLIQNNIEVVSEEVD